MPALKLLLRRTLALAAVNPPSVLSPPATAKRSLSLSGATTTVYCGVGGRGTLAIGKGGACSRIAGAHVMGPTASSKIKPSIYRKRVYMLSSSTSPPFPSSSAQERESGERESGEREGDKLDRVSSSSSSSASLLPDMGHGSHHKSNDGDWDPNGTVSPSDEDQKQPHSSKFLTLPTVLTLARVAAVPVFIATFYANSWWGAAATTSIFVAAAITDWLDGYLARKMCQGSAFGAFLDPVADKLMVAATLVLLCSRPPDNAMFGNIPWLLPVPAIAIIGREITMSAVREWAASQDAKLLQAVAVNNLGKWKTATQMTALTIILATRDSSIASQGALATSGVVLLYISAGLAVWSLVVYMKKIWKVLLR